MLLLALSIDCVTAPYYFDFTMATYDSRLRLLHNSFLLLLSDLPANTIISTMEFIYVILEQYETYKMKKSYIRGLDDNAT